MTELERPRSYKDERDEMIDRETNGAALDAIITGAEVLAIVCWRRKNPAWKGALALLFFALAGKFWPLGGSVRGKGVSQGWSDLWQHWRCALGGVRTRDETPRGKMTPRGKAFWIWKAFFVCARCAILDGKRSGYG